VILSSYAARHLHRPNCILTITVVVYEYGIFGEQYGNERWAKLNREVGN